jgi:hypothetical protein
MTFSKTGFFALLILCAVLQSCAAPEAVVEPGREYAVYPDRPTPDHSGMWPLPLITDNVHRHMSELGLNLHTDEIYHPEQPSLNQAIVRINIGNEGGGTGSFISPGGLILTNHHVAYDGIVSASSTEENYLRSGFYAETAEDEIPIPGYSLYIPIEQTEVTGIIQSRLPDGLGNTQREEMKMEIEQELIEERRAGNDDLAVEIGDYWSGNRQFMVVYRIIRDVRLVYVPEDAVGKFGGDIDNWMWPRHTGDYAFLRAYVSHDGASADYQPSNVPFKPDAHLPFRAGDLYPGDFTMTLGFPGTTYRFESSYAFDFYEKKQFPVLHRAFNAYLKGLERRAELDAYAAVTEAGERASIANALKYYEGVRSGFERYRITDHKRKLDNEFRDWVKTDSLREAAYGNVLPQLRQSYRIAGQTGDILYMSFYAIQFSNLLQMGSLFNDFYEYSKAPDSLYFSSDDRQQLFDMVRMWNESIHMESELLIVSEMLQAMAEMPEDRRPLIMYRFFDSIETEPLQQEIREFMERQSAASALVDTAVASRWIYTEMIFSEEAFNDSLYMISRDLFETFEQSRDNYFQHFRYLEPAQKRYARGIMEMQNEPDRYPDANFTLRLSAGQILGYSPADGVYNTPFTTFSGMLEKHTGREPFNLPARLRYYKQDLSSGQTAFGPYSRSGDLVLNFLSTNDITGGNSGSPVLNGNGEIIGLAFDGNIEGIVSDYHFIPDVTRMISVDVRYILFMMDEIDNTGRLLDEIEVRLD